MDIYEYIGKTIIAWHYYNENFSGDDPVFAGTPNKRCYVYPRIMRQVNGMFVSVKTEDFPTMGRIEVKLQGILTAETVFENFGSIVEIRINDKFGNLNANTDANNWYSMKFNPQFSKDGSEIWIERFTGKNFTQVIKVPGTFSSVLESRQIDLVDTVIHTNEILIECQGKYYGSFDYDVKENKIMLSGRKEYQYYIAEYSRHEFDNAIFDVMDNNGSIKATLINKDRIPSPMYSHIKIDWIDNTKLVDGMVMMLKANNMYTKDQIRKIKDTLIESMQQHCDFNLTPDRAERIEQLIGTVIQQDDFIRQLSYYVLDDSELNNELVQIVCTEHFDIIEKNSRDFTEVRNHIEKLKMEAYEIEKTIENLKNNENTIAEKARLQQQDSLIAIKEEITRLIAERDEMSKKIDLGREIIDLVKLKEKYKQDAEIVEREYKTQVVLQDRLKEQMKKTIDEFGDQTKVIARGIDSKLMDRVLRAASGDEIEDPPLIRFDTSLLHPGMDSKAIIARVADYVREKANRYITDNDIINYLICISQGFITTFAGEPGTGKTSLCNILAKSLGLAGSDCNKRFVDVSVERGWTSHKDFIGYYNPLTKVMEKSNTDVFDALSLLDSEFGSDKSAPFLILLDEANLSPIEHYWAAFLKNCDFDSAQNRTISIGGKKAWRIPEHLRFLATVNFDHTTEELSPRFLDRSWIVTLNPSQVTDETLVNSVIENSSSVVQFESLKFAFTALESDRLDDVIANKWNNIQTIFKNNHLQIMPRNLKMVRNYCLAACRCMDRQSPETRYAPLDYAISQKILPTINGTGDQYKKLIDDLIAECSSLMLCTGHLERIKNVAEENLGFYQFFAR